MRLGAWIFRKVHLTIEGKNHYVERIRVSRWGTGLEL